MTIHKYISLICYKNILLVESGAVYKRSKVEWEYILPERSRSV